MNLFQDCLKKHMQFDQLQTSPPRTAHGWQVNTGPAACFETNSFGAFLRFGWTSGIIVRLSECVQNRKWLVCWNFERIFRTVEFFHALGLDEEKEMHESYWECLHSWSFYVFLLNSLVTRASQARAYLVFFLSSHEMKPKWIQPRKPLIGGLSFRQRKQLSGSCFEGFLSQFNIWQMLRKQSKTIKQLAFKAVSFRCRNPCVFLSRHTHTQQKDTWNLWKFWGLKIHFA